MKTLQIIDHAPDYRESFFRELGRRVDLTVVAQPCVPAGLHPPSDRLGYRYIEIPAGRLGPVCWQSGLRDVVCNGNWDVVCCDVNLRQISRTFLFLTCGRWRSRWVWRGHVFGRSNSKLLDALRGHLLRKSSGCLAYSVPVADEVWKRYGVRARSFNNTQVASDEFKAGIYSDRPKGLRLLYVGRHACRKRLDRLVRLASRRKEISIRLVGPEMGRLEVPEILRASGRIKTIGRTVGDDLDPHFAWADLVVNPGAVGLLVMNAAKYGKGIVIDSNSRHGPECWLAQESRQPFIPFSEDEDVDRFFDNLFENRRKLKEWGKQLQEVAMRKYTIEYMADAHFEFLDKVREEAEHLK